uniref:5-oxoprolinase subunit PxpB n=1 Tax=Staphylothermus marinus TaxID=2280 RepID=A0A7C4H6N6_STAMA
MIRRIPSGGYCYTIEFCKEISRDCIEKIHRVYYSLLNKLSNSFEIVVGLTALTIYYDPRILKYIDLDRIVLEALEDSERFELSFERKEWIIPVVYGGEFGLDIDSVVKYTGLTIDEIIKYHVSKKYLCYAIGFTPGFIYLGELCEKLIVPRLETPRLTVPPGSIGIADRLTGVYSVESPGGWRIIGRTPLKIFDFNRENPMPIKPGDIVSFKSISIEEYYELRDVFISDYHG